MSQSDIERALNIVTYIARQEAIWAGVEFTILQKDNYRWVVMMDKIPRTIEHESLLEAFAYGRGYIDGIIGR